jgi:hypothetical protein
MYREFPFPEDRNARTVLNSYPCQVTAYPSVGGIVLGFFSAVEMVHLQLLRSEPAKRSSDTAEEDELSLRMLRLGAHWWPNPNRYAYHKEQIDDRTPYDFHFPPTITVGYSSTDGGVWVVKYITDSDCINASPSLQRRPDKLASENELRSLNGRTVRCSKAVWCNVLCEAGRLRRHPKDT